MKLTVLPPLRHILSESFCFVTQTYGPYDGPCMQFSSKTALLLTPTLLQSVSESWPAETSWPVQCTKSITMCGQATALHLHLSNARIPRRVR